MLSAVLLIVANTGRPDRRADFTRKLAALAGVFQSGFVLSFNICLIDQWTPAHACQRRGKEKTDNINTALFTLASARFYSERGEEFTFTNYITTIRL